MGKHKGFATRAIHEGQSPDLASGAVIPPITLSSTFYQKSPGCHAGYEYSRTSNPTRESLESCIASLEGGQAGFAFSSGMAAIAAIMECFEAGSHIIAMDDLYGGTYRLFDKVKTLSQHHSFSFVDCSDLESIGQAKQDHTRCLWLESPSNPMMKMVDIKRLSTWARENNILCVVDNTFASPWNQQPLEMGCDVVIHSATKYLNGHSDVVCGCVVVGDNLSLIEKIGFIQNSVGAIASPFDSYLVLRGLKTLDIRMQRHGQNALKIANWLETHAKVEQVYYPGLASHPQFQLAQAQMKTGGGMISFVLKGGLLAATKFLENLEVFILAESLGGVESLVEHPASMTHASVEPSIRQANGLVDGLVRLSVGIESVDDLINDLEQALA